MRTYLEESVLLLRLELVGAKGVGAALGLFFGETLVVALDELEDVLDDDCLEVDLFLIVEVLRTRLNPRQVNICV